MKITLRHTLVAACLAIASAASFAAEAIKVVYHVNGGLEQASDAMRNIRNHLTADPGAKIVVVTHSSGINFLLEGAKDKNGSPYDAMVDDLVLKGIEFRVCNITLTSRNIDRKLIHPEAKIVPSGVAEVSRLQAREGFVYLKP
ncbi:MAG: DsrE family protein [Gammaproteobacteria bacterium]|nr:DsrE family protein [Gammaproteobacteria bacterium]MBU1647695.1 DsrE family protein [Gammaproteobacteria bacterium]MBU1971841.1 DsrE family protein [Gammaproteobacteria bacterium]